MGKQNRHRAKLNELARYRANPGKDQVYSDRVTLTPRMKKLAENITTYRRIAARIPEFEPNEEVLQDKIPAAHELFIAGKINEAESALNDCKNILLAGVSNFFLNSTHRLWTEFAELRDSNRYDIDLVRRVELAVQRFADVLLVEKGYEIKTLETAFNKRIDAFNDILLTKQDIVTEQARRNANLQEKARNARVLRGAREIERVENRVLKPQRERREIAARSLLDLLEPVSP